MTEAIAQVLNNKKIDNRSVPKQPEITQSIIDRETSRIQERLSDPTIDRRFIRKVLKSLSESDIEDALDYVERKAANKGRAFVGLCSKMMTYKEVQA